MTESGNDRARLQHDIFLNVFVDFSHRLQLGIAAVWAGGWGLGSDDLIDARGLGPLPGRMAEGRATLFALGRGAR